MSASSNWICTKSLWPYSKMPSQQLTRSNALTSGCVPSGEMSVLNYTLEYTTQFSVISRWCGWRNCFFYPFMSKPMRGCGASTIKILDLVLTNCKSWVIYQNLNFLVWLWRCNEMTRVSGWWALDKKRATYGAMVSVHEPRIVTNLCTWSSMF